MVKLFNIKRDSNYIYADYLPVGYDDMGSVTVRLSDGERTGWKRPEGNAGHPWFLKYAEKRLRQIMNMEEIPTQTSIAWY